MVKKICFLAIVLCCFSCKKEEAKKDDLYPNSETSQTPIQLGQEIFEGKGNCYACHKSDQKIVGPSIAEIAKIYRDKKGNIISFLKGEGEPLVDPSQYEVMKTNFAITKNFSDEELKAVEVYILSYSK
ncbi:MAG: c-type cytochrome [Flavobacterium sp.]|nr:c-type cytochrome [Flavobacterium sp.]